jgi:hypothetical protein
MAKTRKPPAPPAVETPSPQRRRKKKGRPSLLDLQRRSLRLQAQNPSPADSPARRDPNPSDDDDDGTGSGRRRQKRLKSVLAGGVKVGGILSCAKISKFSEVWVLPTGFWPRDTRRCGTVVVGSVGSDFFGGFLWYGSPPWWGTWGEISGAVPVAVEDFFCFLEGVVFLGGFGILFCFLRSSYDVGILTLSAL